MIDVVGKILTRGDRICAVEAINQKRPTGLQTLAAESQEQEHFLFGKVIELLFADDYVKVILISLQELNPSLHTARQIPPERKFDLVRKRIYP